MIRQGFIEQEVLHEIAMSIGESIEQEKMLAECIPVFLRSLGCATAAVLLQDEDDNFYTPSYILPRAAVRNHFLHQAINKTIECLSNAETLPFPLFHFQDSELYYYAWQIKDLGALLLGRSAPLREGLFREIQPLANKLALALTSCRQYERLKLAQKSLIYARDEAQAANKAKSRFLATMSHEIRTPLNAVINLSELLQESGLDERQYKLTQGICEGGRSLLQLVNDVLDFSRIEAGRMELVPVSFRLHELLDGLVSLFEKEANSKKLHFGLNVSDDVPEFVVADLSRLRQILQNLLVNAIKFTEQGSISITVSSYTPPSDSSLSPVSAHEEAQIPMPMLVFYVSDTGIGISAQDQQRLFHEFTQVDTNLDRRFGGSGLGLAITSRLVRLMGGSIGCHSVIDVGSTFWFTLPVKANVEPLAMPPRQGIPTLSMKMLLVEDSLTNQMVALAMLEKSGCQITLANDGFEALAQVKKTAFDLILMDVSMPGMDGLEATRQIRAMGGRFTEIPIIAMTAHAFSQDRDACMDAGMNDYLSKPLNRNQLYDVLLSWQQTLTGRLGQTVHSETGNATDVGSADAQTSTDTGHQSMRPADMFIDHPEVANPVMDPLSNQSALVETNASSADENDALNSHDAIEPMLDSAIIEALIRDTSHDLFNRLITIFLKESYEHVMQFAECLQQLDFVNAAKHAHAVKSSSGALGAIQLQKMCSILEVGCRAAQPDAAQLHGDFQQAHQIAEQSWQALRELLN